jgi:predicted membrane protein
MCVCHPLFFHFYQKLFPIYFSHFLVFLFRTVNTFYHFCTVVIIISLLFFIKENLCCCFTCNFFKIVIKYLQCKTYHFIHNEAGSQGGRREIRRDNECNSETNKQKKWIWGMSPGVRPEKGHLTPEVKMANEIACDHVWDKLYSSFL